MARNGNGNGGDSSQLQPIKEGEMYATDFQNLTYDPVTRKCKVDIQADSVPASLPTSGADVDNMADDAVFEVGSTLLVVPTAQVYFYGADGAWHLTASADS